MTRELTSQAISKYRESLQVVPVDCPAEIDPFFVIKRLKNTWSGVIVACPRNACCCPKKQKIIKRRELIRDILPVFDLEKERYRIVDVAPFDFTTLDGVIDEMLAQINMLDNVRNYGESISH